MHTYSDITLNEEYPEQWYLYSPVINGTKHFNAMRFFCFGEGIKIEKLSMYIYQGTKTRMDWNVAKYSVPVVSYPVWELLAPMIQDDVQAIPCEVDGVEERFILLNLLNKIDCIDEQKSKIEWPDTEQLNYDLENSPNKVKKYRHVWNLHIDPTRVGDHKLFWTKHWPAQIIRNDVRDAFLAAGFKGPSFIPV